MRTSHIVLSSQQPNLSHREHLALKEQEPQHPAVLISEHQPVFRTSLGALYQGDCLEWLRAVPDEMVDLVFADPPFNLKKLYDKGISDDMAEHEYLDWCFAWIDECVRVLRPGGALYLFNLPKWAVHYGAHLNQRGLIFRHWIACRMPKSMPIPGRMSPSHYALLYYTKGKAKTFHVIRHPVQACRHCGGEVRDYGGHRKALNPEGLRLQDFFDAPDEVFENAPYALPIGNTWTEVDELWEDIPPVRHARHKHREANALAPILLERVIAQSTDLGDLVLDPFGGTGTTYIAAERKERRWLGVELGDTAPAIARMKDFLAGDAPEWERARGNGGAGRKRNRNQLDML